MERFWLSNEGWARIGRVARACLPQRQANRLRTAPIESKDRRDEVRSRLTSAGVCPAYATRGERELADRLARTPQPTWADYQPWINQLVERLDLSSTLTDWLDEARVLEDLLADIAFDHDATSPQLDLDPAIRWATADERDGYEDDPSLDTYVEQIDHLDHGRFSDLMEMRVYGAPSADVLSEDIEGFTVDVYTDSETSPAMTMDIGGTGIHALIEAERRPRRRRLVESGALQLLIRIAETRRWIEDLMLDEQLVDEYGDPVHGQSLGLVEGGKETLSPLSIVNVRDLAALRQMWAAEKTLVDDGVGDPGRLATIARLGAIAAREQERSLRAHTGAQMQAERVSIRC